MNKKFLITILFALTTMMGWAQSICSVKATMDDYIKLLNDQGLCVYALDLSNLEKNQYLMAPVVQVYTCGNPDSVRNSSGRRSSRRDPSGRP